MKILHVKFDRLFPGGLERAAFGDAVERLVGKSAETEITFCWTCRVAIETIYVIAGI